MMADVTTMDPSSTVDTFDNDPKNNLSAITYDMIIQNFIVLNYTIIGLYIPVFLLALCANTLVIVVVLKYHYMRSVTNYFLMNLSVADLLVTIVCMPDAVRHAVTTLWFLGDIACRLINYSQCVAVAASVFTITAMSIDRYLAITQPIGFPRWFNKTSTIVVIMIVWLISFVIFSPLLVVTKVHTEILPVAGKEFQIDFCLEQWDYFGKTYKTYFGIFWFCIIYVVPGTVMIVSYSLMGQRLCSVRPPFDTHEGSASQQQGFRLVRERKRVAWILLLLALLFAACWLPHSILTLLSDAEVIRKDNIFIPYSRLLGHTNSAINPIIYCFMTRNFRRSVKELLWRSRAGLTASSRRSNRCQYLDSGSASSQRYPQKVRLEPILKMRSLRHQSSTRTTKTCAV